MYDIFGYFYQLEYLNVNSFNTKKVQVMQGMFISCSNLKYLDMGHFDYTAMINGKGSCNNNKGCRYHCTFAYLNNLICLNISSFYVDDKLIHKTDNEEDADNDKPFLKIHSEIKYCVNTSKINTNQFSLTNSCNDDCFKKMSKKFDVKDNDYVDECGSTRFEYNDICWEDCPYHYYREIIDGRRTCSKQAPGEHFFLDSDNIYKQCYSTCKTCKESGSQSSHNCDECESDLCLLVIVKMSTQ
jgi:hypothetical protein